MITIAALFVEASGVYSTLPGVELWPESRDARLYRGPHRAVCHPDCGRWGRYWSGGPSAKIRCLLGDDANCFAHSLWVSRTFGGVIEHPEASHAWRWFGLKTPPKNGGWTPADNFGGWACCVEQGHYGHRARKATWLYICGVERIFLPRLKWGPSAGERLDEGFHSKAERASARLAGRAPRRRLSTAENIATPVEFARLLLGLVRGNAMESAA